MKKVLIWISVLVLVAVLSVVGTLAYLTAVDEETNVMTVGDASIKIMEYERVDIDDKNDAASVQAFNDNKHLRPTVVADGFNYANSNYNTPLTDNYVIWDEAHVGEEIKINGAQNYQTPIWNPDDITNEIDKMVFVKNTGDCNVYVRLCFAFEAGNYVRLDRFKQMVHLNLNTTDWDWDWNETRLAEIDGTRCFIAWATYKYPVAPDELTKISLSQIALDFSAINDHARAFGDTYDVKVFAQGIQSDGFATANAALTKGFDNDIPFKNVEFVEFTDLKTALHYLNADTNDLMLKGGDHSKREPESYAVNSVTFGLTEDHLDVAKNHNGVLVANGDGEADFTAYAYYVPNDDKYDVYFLADDWEIYAPADSYGLFYRMAGLTEVDTSNLNFSGATTLQGMFRDCQSLTELDTADWDVSKVTKMNEMFQSCTNLNNIDVSGWNTANVTNMQYMFYKCGKFTSLDVSNWDVGRLTVASYMFRECSNLTYLDVSRWKVDNLEGANEMFNGCGSLQKLDVSDWKLNKVKNFNAMFQYCSSLVYLDVSKWTIDIATNTSAMFNGCKNLKVLDVSNFDVSEVTEMQTMFSGCSSLASLDVSSFNTAAVTTMESMFSGCSSLASLDLSSFDTSNVKKMNSMFVNCSKITEIVFGDDWSTAEVTTMYWMFRYCNSLESLDVSGWDVGKVTTMGGMFFNCLNLKSLDTSMWNPVNLKNAYLMFNACKKITVIDFSSFNPQALTDIGQMFLDCSALEKIYVGYEWPIDQITSTNSVFRNSKKLEGGNGTKFSEYGEKGKLFARIDGGPENPGYFTYKATADATT